MSLVARHLEENAIPTLVLGSARDIVEECGVPRFLFCDFPLGNPAGRPYDRRMQHAIAELALGVESAARPRDRVAQLVLGLGRVEQLEVVRALGGVDAPHLAQAPMEPPAATARVNEDGTCEVWACTQAPQSARATVAATLGLDIDEVNVVAPDTDGAAYDYGTAADRGAHGVSESVHRAALSVKEQLIDMAAEMLECAADDIEVRPGGKGFFANTFDAFVAAG